MSIGPVIQAVVEFFLNVQLRKRRLARWGLYAALVALLALALLTTFASDT